MTMYDGVGGMVRAATVRALPNRIQPGFRRELKKEAVARVTRSDPTVPRRVPWHPASLRTVRDPLPTRTGGVLLAVSHERTVWMYRVCGVNSPSCSRHPTYRSEST